GFEGEGLDTFLGRGGRSPHIPIRCWLAKPPPNRHQISSDAATERPGCHICWLESIWGNKQINNHRKRRTTRYQLVHSAANLSINQCQSNHRGVLPLSQIKSSNAGESAYFLPHFETLTLENVDNILIGFVAV